MPLLKKLRRRDSIVYIFDRTRLLKQGKILAQCAVHHPLLEHACNTIVERISWRQKPIKHLLILGSYTKHLKERIQALLPHECQIVTQFSDLAFDSELIPFEENSFDVILSFFDVQYLNDVPGYLKQLEYCLQPDGLLTGVFIGGHSFHEINHYLLQTESAISCDVCVRFHPHISLSTTADLLKRAGFDCPLVDRDHFVLDKQSMRNHIDVLRQLHATNKMASQKPFPKKLIPFLTTEIPITIDLVYINGLGKKLPEAIPTCAPFPDITKKIISDVTD